MNDSVRFQSFLALLAAVAFASAPVQAEAVPSEEPECFSLSTLSESIARTIQDVSPGVVNITVTSHQEVAYGNLQRADDGTITQPKRQSISRSVQATGFLFDATGHIITTSTILENAESIEVTLPDGRSTSGSVVGKDGLTRVGIVKIDLPGLKPVRITRRPAKTGEMVVCLGNQAGLASSPSLGMVACGQRFVPGLLPGSKAFQVSAPLSAGMAGSPVTDSRGGVIGMLCATYHPFHSRAMGVPDMDPRYEAPTWEQADMLTSNIGFAVPMEVVESVARELIENGKVARAWLGIHVGDVPDDLRQLLNLGPGEGVQIVSVVSDSPAGRAGLRKGDLLLSINGKIISGRHVLIEAVEDIGPDGVAYISVVREGRSRTLQAKLTERPTSF